MADPKCSSESFLERISVNYLRHRLSAYEKHLMAVKGRVGVSQRYVEIKCRVIDAISEKYEWLREECENQKRNAESRET